MLTDIPILILTEIRILSNIHKLVLTDIAILILTDIALLMLTDIPILKLTGTVIYLADAFIQSDVFSESRIRQTVPRAVGVKVCAQRSNSEITLAILGRELMTF